jgi:hypothetical protein
MEIIKHIALIDLDSKSDSFLKRQYKLFWTLRSCLDLLSIYKKLVLAIASKIRFLKNWVVCLETSFYCGRLCGAPVWQARQKGCSTCDNLNQMICCRICYVN